ncbi:hypothetical protein QTP88_005214 [Uroleucon formosanum]
MSVTDQLKTIPVNEFQNYYEQWKHRLQRCVDSQGNYFEGDNVKYDLLNQLTTENPIKIESTINQTSINSLVKNFTDFIIEAASMAIGKTKNNTKRKLVPWWNHECNEAIKFYKKCLNKFKKSKSILDHIQLKKQGHTPDTSPKKAKKNYGKNIQIL